MIFVSHALPVNVPDEPRLTPANVWDGLVLKANNALPFVPAMTYCEVTQRHSDTVFDRDIDFRGQRFTERITLEAPHRVTFTRIAGPVLGTIANEIIDGQTTAWPCASASLWSSSASPAGRPRSRRTPTP